jgi:hypothetical protein
MTNTRWRPGFSAELEENENTAQWRDNLNEKPNAFAGVRFRTELNF